MQIIFGNYGDNTLALIQWAHENSLSGIVVVHVETEWTNDAWAMRIKNCQSLVSRYNYSAHCLFPTLSFRDLIKDRQDFPNEKFQWCTTFLKTLPLLSWLEEVDPRGEATILLGSRRADSRARLKLQETINESEYYGDRALWFPLYNHTDQMRNALIARSGLPLLNHRSMECDPCIHNLPQDFMQMKTDSIKRLEVLEQEITLTMFKKPISEMVLLSESKQANQNYLEAFDKGCGSRYVCGE